MVFAGDFIAGGVGVTPLDEVEVLFALGHGLVPEQVGAVGAGEGLPFGHDLAFGQVGDAVIHPDVLLQVADGVQGQDAIGRLVKDEAEGLLGTLDIVVGQFFAEGIIHHRVGNLRPTVDEIPPDDARPAPFGHAETLDEIFLRLGLGDLAGAGEIFQIVRFLAKEGFDLVGHEANAVDAGI